MISVVVADDQAMVRGGIATILSAEVDIEVTGQAADGAAAVELARELRPDVVLLDIRMPVMDGLAATALIRSASPSVHVLALTTFDRSEYLYEALRAGAEGFLLKTSPPSDLARAVRLVASGEALVDPTMTRRLIEHFMSRPPPEVRATPPPLAALTDRERDVLRLLALGLSNGEIAARIHLAVPTVKTHVNAILRKLGLRDRVQAVVFAYEHGIAVPGQSGGSGSPS